MARGADRDEDEEEEEKDGGTAWGSIFSIQNVGGNLFTVLQLALMTWGIRELRRAWAAHSAAKARAASFAQGSAAPAFAGISAAALRLLVDTQPLPYAIIDCRPREEARASPAPFKDVLVIPEPELRFALQLPPPAWEARYGPAPLPDRRKAVVFLSANGRRSAQAAASAASVGYSRCLVLQGGLAAYMSEAKSERRPARCLSRHAVALLLQGQARPVANGGDGHAEAGHAAAGGCAERGGQPPVVVVDLRRHDERALYGAIQGSVHIPVDQWARALALDGEAWEAVYHCPKLGRDALLVLACRTERRSTWAAQVAHDCGLRRVFVLSGGTNGWRFDPQVEVYDGYKEGSAPPAPVPFEVEKVDEEAATKELRDLGLLR
ncbi:hypothetical protein KFL_003480200 [Klebsormidium nitens]|uniref:Rhodanese domain-containing protein n=1 Tax=Klebsormidium nitens TaxID=105231 RepID=A0A1Y1IF31_KLENI|nr:hypothetical protein KFL_003480200 [Klebsormidium nitens]|eukprot:GAQ87376.1 hypothetical protein KFL_003480200 [Klebsormidium nitens]